MSKFTQAALSIAAVTCVTLFGVAQQPKPAIKSVPLQQISPASGQQMYAAYCATCHGAKATGNGPAALALKIPPTDLTSLSKKNGGVFPTSHVMSVLQLGIENPAHGSPEMPIWGSLFLDLNTSSQTGPAMVRQRVFNITNYLKEIQK